MVHIDKKGKIIDIVLLQEVIIIDKRVKMISDEGNRKSFIINLDEISVDEVISGLSKVTRIEEINISSISMEGFL